MKPNNSNQKFLLSTEEIYKKEKKRQIIRMLLFSTLVIFTVESLLMVLLELILDIPEPEVWFVDGAILVVLLFPLNYIFIVQPMLRQIEEHRKTNLTLLKTNDILGRFFEISDILIAYMDADFNFLRVNKAYANADQKVPEFYVGKNHFDLFPNEENQGLFQKVVDTGETLYIIEKPFEYVANLDRGVSYWDWTLLPIKNNSGKVIELILVLTDRTAHKKAQMALVDSERRFRAVFNQTFQLIGLLDSQGNVMLVNETALDFSGVGSDEIYGKPFWELPWWDQTAPERMSLKSAVLQAGKAITTRGVHPMRSNTGERAIMDITIKPMLDDAGNPILLISEARDITDWIRSEENLKQSQEEINRLYQAEIQARTIAETLRDSAQALSSSLDSDVVFETLLDSLYKMVGYTSAHIEILDGKDHLFVRFARGEEDWDYEKRVLGKRLPVKDLEVLQPILKDRQVIQVADTKNYKGSKYYPGNRFIGSWVAIPLLAGDQVIGLCILEHVSPNYFTPELIQFAITITNQAAIAIQNAWLYEQVRDGREHLSALSRRLVEVQESERQYVARELHDDAGQALASLMMGLRLLEREGGDKQAVIARSRELKQIADEVLENLHRLAVNLRPTALDHLGLIPALRQYTEVISSKQNLEVQFEVIGEFERFSDEMETAVYRIVQEALTNVVRHSQATHAELLLERSNKSILVKVKDNGIGFDPKVKLPDHLGMVGMRERADMLNGTITVESSPGSGSTIILEVPCPFEL